MNPPMTGVEAARTPGSGVRAAPLPTGVVALLDGLGAVALLTRDAVHAALRRPPEWSTIAEQLEQVGWRSLSIVNLTAFFTGMVRALQLGTSMARFGAKLFVSRIVGMALVRELGPVLTALMIGGRVGAGITAELGTMAVTDQIDAIRALGASPIRNLVVPRLIAVLVMLPVLTIIGDLVGILGGLLLSVTELNVSGEFYINSLVQVLYLRDVFSGVGKSFFFAYFIGIIACLNGLHVTGGADGVVPQRLDEDALVPLRRNVAMLFQQGALFDSLTVGENIAYPLREHRLLPPAALPGRVRQALEMVGLAGSENLMPAELSGGMRKRAALARALVLEPRALLYDEPTTGLDPVVAAKINHLIRDMQRRLGVSSVVVTHDLGSAFLVADRIAFLHDGRIRFIGTPDEARASRDPFLHEFLNAA